MPSHFILTGIMNRMEQRLSGENKEADQNWTILTEASSNNGSVTKK